MVSSLSRMLQQSCGKAVTLFARKGADLLRCDRDTREGVEGLWFTLTCIVFSKFHGETERNLRLLFYQAKEHSPSGSWRCFLHLRTCC